MAVMRPSSEQLERDGLCGLVPLRRFVSSHSSGDPPGPGEGIIPLRLALPEENPALQTGTLDAITPSLSPDLAMHRNGRRWSAFRLWLPALALSGILHAAPVGLFLIAAPPNEPVGIGEAMVDVEFVVAEASVPVPVVVEALPQPPDPQSTMPPSVEASQAPDARPEEQQSEEEPEIRLPIEEPQPVTFRAEERVMSVANAAPMMAAASAAKAARNDSYRAQIGRHLAKFKRFPPGLPRNIRHGRVMLRFRLAGQGEIADVAVLESSGVGLIDREALAMLRRAVPFPLREGRGRADEEFTIPISYHIR